MTTYTVHTHDTAPEAAKPLLANSQKAFGFVPNLHSVMAQSPAILEAYQTMVGIATKTGLNAVERQVVYQVNNFEAECQYCVAAHTTISGFDKVPEDITAALRAGKRLPDGKLEALASFARKMRNSFGRVTAEDSAAFFAAGYSKEHLLGVIVLTATKVLSNYTNKIAHTPVDDQFSANSWEKPAAEAAK
jgi:alkylhydroperoxidase family enzyme